MANKNWFYFKGLPDNTELWACCFILTKKLDGVRIAIPPKKVKKIAGEEDAYFCVKSNKKINFSGGTAWNWLFSETESQAIINYNGLIDKCEKDLREFGKPKKLNIEEISKEILSRKIQ